MKSYQPQQSGAAFTTKAVRHALLLFLVYRQGNALQSANKEAGLRAAEEGSPKVHSAAIRGAYGVASRPLTGQLAHPPAPWLFEQLRLYLGRAMRPLLELKGPAEDHSSLLLGESTPSIDEPVHNLPSFTNAGPENSHAWHRRSHSVTRGKFLQLKAVLGFLLPWQSTAISMQPRRSFADMAVKWEDNATTAQQEVSAPSDFSDWESSLMMTLRDHKDGYFHYGQASLSDFLKSDLFIFWIIAIGAYLLSLMLTLGVWWWFYTEEDNADEEEKDGSLGRSLATPFVEQYDKEDSEEEEEVSFSASLRSSQQLVRRGNFSRGMSNATMKAARQSNESRWLRASEEERYREGAYTLTLLGGLLFTFECVRQFNRPKCASSNWLLHGIELGVVAILIVKTAYCTYKPNKGLYWFGVSFYFFYIPAVMLPPFQMSCTDLFEMCKDSDDWYVKEAMDHVNCSLQGQTSQQVFMTLFLFLPWLLPKLDMMTFTLVWVLGVYLFWTMAYVEFVDQGFYTTRDVGIRLVLLFTSLGLAYVKKKKLQKAQMDLWISDQMQVGAKRRMLQVFIEMLPPHVIPDVYKYGRCHSSHQIVSILFVVIDDFDDKYVNKMETDELLNFLNGLFSEFDAICSRHGVTKIETVGEEYVACVGVTPEHAEETHLSGGHEQILSNLFQAASDIMRQQTDELKFKMGIHSGPVIAGVVGKKLPRFRLFGDTINTAARMMQKGVLGKVQFGAETKAHLPDKVLPYVEDRGLVEMKGKGQVQTYLFSNKRLNPDPEPDSNDKGTPMAVPMEEPEVPDSSRSQKRRVTFSEPAADFMRRVRTHTHSATHGLLNKLLHSRSRMSSYISQKSTRSEIEGSSKSGLDVSTRTPGLLSIEEEIMQRTAEDDSEDSPPSKHWLFDVYPMKRILSSKKGFTPELEAAFITEFHRSFMKKMVPNLDKTFLICLVVSGLEAIFMAWNRCWHHDHDYFPGMLRIPIFIVCRVLVLINVAYVRKAAAAASWSFSEPSKFQWTVVFGVCLDVILIFFSYDVLTTGQHKTNTKSHAQDAWQAPIDQCFSLLFMLIFFTVIRWKFLFYQSLVFVGLALVILFFIDLRALNGVYFPYLGQVLFFGLAVANAVLAHEDEQSNRSRFKAQRKTREARKKINNILETMMPPLVLKRIKDSSETLSNFDTYKRCTIAQSDLCGFTKLASTRSPREVVDLISEIFNRFDDLTEKYGIYKVETVGDAYIAGMAEEPLTVRESPWSVVQFGKGMILAVRQWSKEQGVNVKCRVGVNHGRCVGGIVGTNQQRYHLFGKLLAGLEVLESTAPESAVQMSKDCKEAVDRELKETNKAEGDTEYSPGEWCIEREGEFLKTSKGERHEYDKVGGRTFVIYHI